MTLKRCWYGTENRQIVQRMRTYRKPINTSSYTSKIRSCDRPITYACEISGFEKLHMIEKVHIEFLRSIISVNKSTPLYMIYGELGRYPLEIYIKCIMIGYWSRLILGNMKRYHLRLNKFYYITLMMVIIRISELCQLNVF